MKLNHNYSSRFRILKGGKISLIVSALFGSAILSFASPSGGVVTSGNATISQVGKTTNINQSSLKASINWQKFGIKADEVVNFNQPNVNSITLNRVIGNERSVIDGALNANGQVWILNSNGVLFGKNASINTSGILTTTKNLSDEDFNKGNYSFSGDSTESIINQGTIKVKNNGYVIFASNEAKNSGTIEAIKGRVQLTSADEYTINLNGNSLIDLSVDKGTLDALVENSGTILADGGEVYLTTHAVDELLRAVVNNTGIIEANSLDGINGHIELFAHGGTANIAGTIKAKGGFVETSGKELNVASTTSIETSKWLLDPVNMTIESTGGSDITGASVSATAIKSNLATTDIELLADNDIIVNEDITWGEATKLTLSAGNEIYVNATIENTNNTYGGVYFNAVNRNAAIKFDVTTGKVIVNNINQLQWINQALNGNYELGSNIDASITSTWNSGAGFQQIGNNATGNIYTQFTGVFDGKGYIIDGLYINRGGEDSVGLFGHTGAYGANKGTILNVGLINVDITGRDGVGGLVGYNDFSTITNSYVTGKVSADTRVGGLVGVNYSSTITNSYSTGNVSGNDFVGGLVGINYNSSITNSYSTGNVSGNTNVGGLVGGKHITTITNSYWDIDTTGQTNGVGYGDATGVTGVYSSTNTINAFDKDTYAGFDFTNTWFMIEGETRPFLRSEYSTTITNDHQLQLMAMNLGADYVLANDIKYTGDMWSSKGFDPIGTNATRFTGSFDGQGYVIDGLYINKNSASIIGLFGIIEDASISNVGLTNVDITGNDYVGGLVGRNYTSIIQNSFTTGDVSGNNHIGGLVGSNDVFSLVRNTYSFVDVSGNNYIGGLIGHHYDSIVENSYAIGNVSGNSNVGGLIGHWYDATVRSTYYDRDTTGLTNGIGNGGMGGGIYSSTNTVNAFNQATYIGFDFTNNWIIYEEHTRPLLRTFMTELTVKANDVTRTYDGTVYNGGSTGVTYSNPSYDSSLVQGSLNYTSSGDLKNAGTATINLDGLYSSQQGYIINYDTGTLTTNKKDITVTANSKATTYDGTVQNTSGFTASGLVSGETVAVLDGVTGDSASGKNAGTYNTNLSGTDENYNLTFVDGSLVISKKELTANYTAGNKVYDGTTNANVNGTLDGVISGDNITLDSFLASFSDKNVGDNKAISISNISLGGTSSSNYTIASSSSSTASITPKNISATFTADNKVYDGTLDATASGTLSGVILGDDITISQTASFSDKDAGENKTVNITDISLGGTDITNYSFDNSDTTTTASINKALATVTVDNKEVIYDGNTHTIDNYTVTGLVNNEDKSVLDSISISGSGRNAGTYTILALGEDDNYNLEFIDGSLTITPKSIVATFTANDKEYDGSTTAIANGSLSGVIQGDDIKAIYSSANFEDEKPANNKNVYIEGISLTGTDSQNYTLLEDSFITTANINNSLGSLIASIINGSNINSIEDFNNIDFNSLDINPEEITNIQNIITDLLQQGETSFPIIKGIVLRILDGGINMPYGTKRELILDEDEEEKKKGNSI